MWKKVNRPEGTHEPDLSLFCLSDQDLTLSAECFSRPGLVSVWGALSRDVFGEARTTPSSPSRRTPPRARSLFWLLLWAHRPGWTMKCLVLNTTDLKTHFLHMFFIPVKHTFRIMLWGTFLVLSLLLSLGREAPLGVLCSTQAGGSGALRGTPGITRRRKRGPYITGVAPSPVTDNLQVTWKKIKTDILKLTIVYWVWGK